MREFVGRVIAGVFAILAYELTNMCIDKLFWMRTKFLKDACEKYLGVKCMQGKLTISEKEQLAIVPFEKYQYVLFDMDVVKGLKKLSESDLRVTILNAFEEKDQSGS